MQIFRQKVGSLLLLAGLTAAGASAASVSFNFYIDDYATVSIDSVLVGSYDAVPAGNIDFTLDLTPGWHDLDIVYANRFGTNFLNMATQYAGDPGFTLVPVNALRSLDAGGLTVSGLRADYYDSLGGTYQFTIYGEGPLRNGAVSFTDELYEGTSGLWAGVYGPSANFAEHLTGQINIVGTPEPSAGILAGIALVGILARKRRSMAKP